ncbi:hypothetical protein HDU98_011332 [Podochytrium sp. JEL0797]|nr:hypothetical protein HDU98_011332 [Podochytrium sp. JEL0797]
MIPHNHLQHEGEIEVQRQRGTAFESALSLGTDAMPPQHAHFFSGLPYLAFAACDTLGRPWATLLVAAFSSIAEFQTLKIKAVLPPDDPVANCVVAAKEPLIQWAGLGIDFTNRRRNKVAGVVNSATRDGSKLSLHLTTTDNMGNCPKYITLRDVTYHERTPQTIHNDANGIQNIAFSQEERDLINRSSTIYLSSRHFTDDPATTDMGLNHRGGPPGFVRVLEEGGVSSLIIPDYSGNRLYQSLGNIQSDKLAGVVVLCFETGDMLYLTGTAENIFDAEAEAIMPRCSLVTRIRPTGRVFIRNGLNLKLTSKEQFSPYNPPVRYLTAELESSGKAIHTSANNTATLTSISKHTPSISTFTFQLSHPVEYLPGAFAIFDFSSVFKREYRHMSQSNPKLVNDDLIRTWTISNPPPQDDTGTFLPTRLISCTIKRVEGGAISSFLHRLPDPSNNPIGALTVRFSGTGGGFTCFKANNESPSSNLLFIAAGIGITPFLAMSTAFNPRVSLTTNIHVLFSARGVESSLANEFENTSAVKHVALFDSTAGSACGSVSEKSVLHSRRIRESDIGECPGLLERDIFLCGPVPFMKQVVEWLEKAGVDSRRIHQDSFEF